MMTPRKAAVLSLNSCIKNGKFINLELDAAIKKYGFEDKDKSFFTRLLYGTVERKITLDYIISKLSSVKLEKIDKLVLCILETGLYQIFFMDRVPDSAACNEATELVKVTCTSSDESVISISEDGYYYADQPGTATITITAGDITKEVKVTVVDEDASSEDAEEE